MTPQELIDAANNSRAVKGFNTSNPNKPMPAAFLISMQFRIVMRVLPHISLYVKPHKWREPRALLPEKASGPPFVETGNVVRFTDCDKVRWERVVIAVCGDFAYCWRNYYGGGTIFTPLHLIEEVLSDS